MVHWVLLKMGKKKTSETNVSVTHSTHHVTRHKFLPTIKALTIGIQPTDCTVYGYIAPWAGKYLL